MCPATDISQYNAVLGLHNILFKCLNYDHVYVPASIFSKNKKKYCSGILLVSVVAYTGTPFFFFFFVCCDLPFKYFYVIASSVGCKECNQLFSE